MFVKPFNIFMILLITLFLIACNPPKENEEEEEEEIVKKAYDVTTYVTLGDKSKLLEKQVDDQTVIDLNPSGIKLSIDPTITYQQMDGFGAAMTESSAYVISQLESDDKSDIMTSLFGESGIGISFVRLTIGASDFSLDNYTYNDTINNEPDLDLENFSIERETTMLIPRLQEA